MQQQILCVNIDETEEEWKSYLMNCIALTAAWIDLEQRFKEIVVKEKEKQSANQIFYDIRFVDGISISRQLKDFECTFKQIADSDSQPSGTAK